MDGSSDTRKRRRVRLLQRYVLNPPMKLLTWAGLTPGHVLLETLGRRTGKVRRNVVLMHREGDTGWIIAEHGTHAGYVRNLQADPHVRVRLRRRWYPAHARILANDDAEARLESFDQPRHAADIRRFGTKLTTIRIDIDPQPAATTSPQHTGPG